MTGSGKILWHKSELLCLYSRVRGDGGKWYELKRAHSPPRPCRRNAGLEEVTSEVALYQVILIGRGSYLFGIFPGMSVSCPCTSFM